MSDTWDPRKRHTCHDCGCLEGELHSPGCDMERCPFCLRQLISCGCPYSHFYPSYKNPSRMTMQELEDENDTCGLPLEVYEKGLPEEQAAEWEGLLEEKGRVPHVVTPNLCARCGEVWPEMFNREDWDDVIPADVRKEMLCLDCYKTVKTFVLEARNSVSK